MATLLVMRTLVRDILNESTATYWTDAQLNNWINQGCSDVARRAENLLKVTSPALVSAAATQDVSAPADMLRIHRVEHKYNSETFKYALQYRDLMTMDSLWGSRPDMPGRPQFYTLWTTPPNTIVRLFPVPISIGTITVYYYRTSVDATADGNTVDIQTGWEECIENYCEFKAKRKDQDPTWTEAKALYEEKVGQMITTTRRLTDQAGMVTTGNGVSIPQWLYAGDGGY